MSGQTLGKQPRQRYPVTILVFVSRATQMSNESTSSLNKDVNIEADSETGPNRDCSEEPNSIVSVDFCNVHNISKPSSEPFTA